ncbi:hypothetical protein HD597_012137 [Nonomuraea thailandensis]|uniref:Uncharacterized protein n=1 Tax=Nonomuraea thailandensis TaxID=1188745 RepID=A0A9X2GWN2_9ACTN|nr:hypothetical protein [Nonomuraea thailandensis]MCP2365117.1 hypothetical protein [Nonomuraea thailandensis]
MTEDAWEQIKTRTASLLSRGDPQAQERQAVRLEDSRQELLSADDRTRVADEQQTIWRTRLIDMLEDDPSIAPPLDRLVIFIESHIASGTVQAGAVQLNASAHDQAQQAVQGQGTQRNTFRSSAP